MKKGFSLVEMLMALLVASLLMVALAPVITKKFSENLSISSIGGTRADYKRTWYYDPAKEYHEWSVPNGVNVIKVTAIGGGGAGGGSSFGNRIFTTTQNWVVPEGVTKLRVFMTGGGGAGASGGAGKGIAYGDIGGSTGNSGALTTTGVSTWTIPAGAKGNVPEVDIKCKSSNVDKWTLVSDTSKTVSSGDTVVTVVACGGGGGGGGGGNALTNMYDMNGAGGGSGGLVNKTVALSSSLTSVSITIGGGGGGGGADNSRSSYLGRAGAAWGGGGGGTEYGSLHAAKGFAPGGNGASCSGQCGSVYAYATNATGNYSLTTDDGTVLTAGLGGNNSSTTYGHKAGSGSLEGGGGGGGAGPGGGGGGGGGATFFGNYANSLTTDKSFFLVAPGGGGGAHTSGGGGGGGGGAGGGKGDNNNNDENFCSNSTGGRGGTNGDAGVTCSGDTGGRGGLSPIGNSQYCAGGKGGDNGYGGEDGKPGYMKISWAPAANALKCDFTQSANGSGGGGAGQVWFGEVTVTPNATIKMTVGQGGTPSTLSATKGGDGEATSIGTLVSVSGGKGGTYKEEDANINFSLGAGGKYLDTNLKNWTSISDTDFTALKSLMGLNGGPGVIASDGATGGVGGNTVDRFGATVYGGDAGNAESNGGDAQGYGAGGGGGGGVKNSGGSPGLGGKGGAGYIYVEWGGTNGGGGASGQVITQESVWVTPGTIVKIYPGKGGIAPELTVQKDASNVEQGKKGENGPDGGDTYLMVKDASAEKKVGVAKGGKGGFAGTVTHGRGGGIKVDGSGSYDPNNIIPEIENTTPGETADDEKGGMGGTIDEVMCPLLTELKKVGLGGCGGNTTTTGSCQNSVLVTGEGVNAGGIGNGGGGGAVTNTAGVKTPYKGGNGSGGMVTIEWSN